MASYELLALANAGGTNPYPTRVGSSDTATLSGNMTITGNLEVQGTATYINTTNMDVEDANIGMNIGYVGASAKTGGFTLTSLASASSTIGLTAVASSSTFEISPTVNIGNTGSGQIVQLSGMANPANNGFVRIVTNAGNGLYTIDTAPAEGWLLSALVPDATIQGTAAAVTVSRIQQAAGVWQQAYGSTSPLTYSALSPTNPFIQSGNSFGANAVLGTNDAFDLSFETTGSTRLTLDAAGTSLTAQQAFSYLGASNAAFTFSAQGTGALGLGTSGTGAITIGNSTNTTSVVLSDNVASAFLVAEGAQNYLKVITTNTSESINLGNATNNPDVEVLGNGQVIAGLNTNASGPPIAFVDNPDSGLTASASAVSVVFDNVNSLLVDNSGAAVPTFSATSGGQLTMSPGAAGGFTIGAATAGDALYAAPGSTNALLKTNASAIGTSQNFVGICKSFAAGEVALTMAGACYPTFAAAPAAASNGSPVYLSAATAGEVTLTAPSASGSAVVRIGMLVGGNGASTNPRVMLTGTTVITVNP